MVEAEVSKPSIRCVCGRLELPASEQKNYLKDKEHDDLTRKLNYNRSVRHSPNLNVHNDNRTIHHRMIENNKDLINVSMNISENLFLNKKNDFIQCESCLVWQHFDCVGLKEKLPPGLTYLCEICDPFSYATRVQQNRIDSRRRRNELTKSRKIEENKTKNVKEDISHNHINRSNDSATSRISRQIPRTTQNEFRKPAQTVTSPADISPPSFAHRSKNNKIVLEMTEKNTSKESGLNNNNNASSPSSPTTPLTSRHSKLSRIPKMKTMSPNNSESVNNVNNQVNYHPLPQPQWSSTSRRNTMNSRVASQDFHGAFFADNILISKIDTTDVLTKKHKRQLSADSADKKHHTSSETEEEEEEDTNRYNSTFEENGKNTKYSKQIKYSKNNCPSINTDVHLIDQYPTPPDTAIVKTPLHLPSTKFSLSKKEDNSPSKNSTFPLKENIFHQNETNGADENSILTKHLLSPSKSIIPNYISDDTELVSTPLFPINISAPNSLSKTYAKRNSKSQYDSYHHKDGIHEISPLLSNDDHHHTNNITNHLSENHSSSPKLYSLQEMRKRVNLMLSWCRRTRHDGEFSLYGDVLVKHELNSSNHKKSKINHSVQFKTTSNHDQVTCGEAANELENELHRWWDVYGCASMENLIKIESPNISTKFTGHITNLHLDNSTKSRD